MTNFMKILASYLWYFFISCVMIAMTICVIISIAQGIVEFKDWLKDRKEEEE